MRQAAENAQSHGDRLAPRRRAPFQTLARAGSRRAASGRLRKTTIFRRSAFSAAAWDGQTEGQTGAGRQRCARTHTRAAAAAAAAASGRPGGRASRDGRAQRGLEARAAAAASGGRGGRGLGGAPRNRVRARARHRGAGARARHPRGIGGGGVRGEGRARERSAAPPALRPRARAIGGRRNEGGAPTARAAHAPKLSNGRPPTLALAPLAWPAPRLRARARALAWCA